MTGLHLSAKVPKSENRSATPPAQSLGTRPSSGARALALAHYIEDLLESGRVTSAAEAANHLGVTRARVSQVMALLGLSAPLQEQVLIGDLVMSGRELRTYLCSAVWAAHGQAHDITQVRE